MSAKTVNWRESATLILVAKQHLISTNQTAETACSNYKILTMKRSSKSKFLPDNHVFPGGTLNKADCSYDWIKLFEKFGVHKKSFDTFRNIKNVSPIFNNKNYDNIPKYISLRICAVRETFEECGVLLCKRFKSENTGNRSLWASYFGDLNLEEWQKLVHNDPNKFIELCATFEIYPDIWALHEWSNWLTPAGMSQRFDTIFFLAAIQNTPPTLAEKTEVQHLEWAFPQELLQKNIDNSIYLPTPQIYELSRIMNFLTVEALAKFSQERSIYGIERFLPYILPTQKQFLLLLPGDELYPKDAQIPNKNIIDEIPDCQVMHRIINPETFKVYITTANYTPLIKHVLPVKSFKNGSKL